jgi:hypothetical protein
MTITKVPPASAPPGTVPVHVPTKLQLALPSPVDASDAASASTTPASVSVAPSGVLVAASVAPASAEELVPPSLPPFDPLLEVLDEHATATIASTDTNPTLRIIDMEDPLVCRMHHCWHAWP